MVAGSLERILQPLAERIVAHKRHQFMNHRTTALFRQPALIHGHTRNRTQWRSITSPFMLKRNP